MSQRKNILDSSRGTASQINLWLAHTNWFDHLFVRHGALLFPRLVANSWVYSPVPALEECQVPGETDAYHHALLWWKTHLNWWKPSRSWKFSSMDGMVRQTRIIKDLELGSLLQRPACRQSAQVRDAFLKVMGTEGSGRNCLLTIQGQPS